MPFMDDFTRAIDEMRAAMDALNSKLIKVEDAIESHFHIHRTATIMKNVEKELSSWPSTTSEPSKTITK